MKRVTLFLLLGLLLGTGVAYAAFQYRVSVSMRGEIVASVQPGLVAAPATIDFAGILPGTKSPIRTVEVTNAGVAALNRLAFAAEGLPPGVVFLASYSPNTLVAPGEKWTVWVQLEVAADVAPQGLTGEITIDAE